jgi:nitrite reductase/ring-hydroxylating ferredoxin subunit
MSECLPLCPSHELLEGGLAVPFDVLYDGQDCRAFAVRSKGKVQAYLNRCTHIAMEMDYQPDRFFDEAGQWLMCATHGATYDPATGACVGGPCQGGLIKIELTERDAQVFWHPTHKLQPPPATEFPPSPFE